MLQPSDIPLPAPKKRVTDEPRAVALKEFQTNILQRAYDQGIVNVQYFLERFGRTFLLKVNGKLRIKLLIAMQLVGDEIVATVVPQETAQEMFNAVFAGARPEKKNKVMENVLLTFPASEQMVCLDPNELWEMLDQHPFWMAASETPDLENIQQFIRYVVEQALEPGLLLAEDFVRGRMAGILSKYATAEDAQALGQLLLEAQACEQPPSADTMLNILFETLITRVPLSDLRELVIAPGIGGVARVLASVTSARSPSSKPPHANGSDPFPK